MNDIKFIKTTQIMIFAADEIDYSSLNNEISINQIVSTFSLKNINVQEQLVIPIPQLFFQNGIYKNKKETYIIEQLVIEDRKITFSIISDSSISDLFFEELKKLLHSLDLRKNKGSYDSLICTYETVCILKLNFHVSKILGNIQLNKLEEKITDKNCYGANISIIPSAIRFLIKYDNIPSRLIKNKITIADKFLVIELRDKTDPDDQIYYTASPTDSNTHFELLKILEKMLLDR